MRRSGRACGIRIVAAVWRPMALVLATRSKLVPPCRRYMSHRGDPLISEVPLQADRLHVSHEVA